MSYLRYAAVLSLLVLVASCSREASRGEAAARPPKASEPRLVSPAGAKAAEPAAVSAPNGEAYLAYVEHGAEGSDVFVQSVDAEGRLKGDRVRVNDEPGVAKSWRGDPPTLALASDSTVYVGWTRKYADPNSRGTDLMLSASRDGGRSFAPAVKVNDDRDPASHGMHSLAVDSNSRIIMAWLDERNVGKGDHEQQAEIKTHHEEVEPNSEVFTAVSTDGGKTFSPNRKIASDVCPCCKTSLLVDEAGTVYASWRQVLEGDHRHMAVASSNDGGLTFTPGVVVSNDQWQLSACPVSGAALTSSGPNQIEVTWYTAGSAGVAGVYSAKSIDGGKTFSERHLITSIAAAGTPVVGPAYRVFNALDGAIAVQRVSGIGTPVDINNALVPAAATVGSGTLVTFVRVKGDAASVWTTLLPN